MSSDLVLVSTTSRVRWLQMNNPRRLNGWTLPMQDALAEAFRDAAEDPAVGAVVLTGTGSYYSAGVDLGGALRLGHPRRLRAAIVKANHDLFDRFIQFPKPILAAVNGAAIGAPVTSATLCDAIVAAEEATFATPFARLGLPPEGCSSVLFPRLLNETNAARMLGPEGWRPTAREALEVGLVNRVVAQDELVQEAQRMAEGWLAEGRARSFRGGASNAELEAANARESEAVADSLLSPEFLMNQYRFLSSRKKRGPALSFLALRATRPLWALLL